MQEELKLWTYLHWISRKEFAFIDLYLYSNQIFCMDIDDSTDMCVYVCI